jgi:hypothetical protein
VFGRPDESHTIEALATRFTRFGYRFVPLATQSLELLCSAHVLLLRPVGERSVIQSGDLDNRLKTVFDALKMPTDHAQLGRYRAPGENEDPFFCLLEDDKLIARATVEADTLLEDPPNTNHAKLVITVKLWPTTLKPGNAGFA